MHHKTLSFIAICAYLFLIPTSYSYAAPAPPILSIPASNANVAGTSVSFSWNASPGGSQYNLWVRRTSDNVVIFNQNVGNITSHILTGLPNDGSDYFWMVRAGSYSTGWGVWSSSRRFFNGGSTATIPALPTLSSPASNANVAGTSVNLSWSASSGATQYWLWARRNSDNVVIFNQNVGNNTSYNLTGLPNNGGDYFWMVRAGNSGGWSTWTGARRFFNGGGATTIPALPTLSSPASNANVAGTSVNLSWSASSGATQYWLWARRNSDNVVIFNQNVGNNTSYNLTGLPNNGGDYFWMVRAGNSGGWSTWTGARRFFNGGTSSGLTGDIEKYMAMVTSVGELSPMIDEISTVLGEILNGDSSVVTSVPPLDTLDPENLPSTLTITANFGSGYKPEGSTSVYTGTAVITITNLNVSDTGISADVAITATNVKRDGKLVLNGGMTLGLNIGVSGNNMTVIANVNFSNLQSLDFQINGGLLVNAPSVNIQAGTFSPMTITFNQFKTKDFLFSSGTVKLTQNGQKYDALFNLATDQGLVTGLARVDNSNPDKPVISTPTTLAAGKYILDINNVIMDSSDVATCSKLPISGNIVITGSSETKTITFNNNCTYTIN